MNGLICYRIAGGELTDIVASYDGFITIEPENYRNHTTKIPIADKFTINEPDVLNVAIQITTNGKSVLHKSTRIICKDGVITAYDFGLVELGDDTDWMIELSNALTTYLTKDPIIAADSAIMEKNEMPDNSVVKSFGAALEKYIGKDPIIAAGYIPVTEADISSDKEVLNSFATALTNYVGKEPIAGTDSIPVTEMGSMDKEVLNSFGNALTKYVGKQPIAGTDSIPVTEMGSMDKEVLNSFAASLLAYIGKKSIYTNSVVEYFKPWPKRKSFLKYLETIGVTGTILEYITTHLQYENIVYDNFDNIDKAYWLRINQFGYTGLVYENKTPLAPSSYEDKMPYFFDKGNQYSLYTNRPCVLFNFWRMLCGDEVKFTISYEFIKTNLVDLLTKTMQEVNGIKDKLKYNNIYKKLTDLITKIPVSERGFEERQTPDILFQIYCQCIQILRIANETSTISLKSRACELLVKLAYYSQDLKCSSYEGQCDFIDEPINKSELYEFVFNELNKFYEVCKTKSKSGVDISLSKIKVDKLDALRSAVKVVGKAGSNMLNDKGLGPHTALASLVAGVTVKGGDPTELTQSEIASGAATNDYIEMMPYKKIDGLFVLLSTQKTNIKNQLGGIMDSIQNLKEKKEAEIKTKEEEINAKEEEINAKKIAVLIERLTDKQDIKAQIPILENDIIKLKQQIVELENDYIRKIQLEYDKHAKECIKYMKECHEIFKHIHSLYKDAISLEDIDAISLEENDVNMDDITIMQYVEMISKEINAMEETMKSQKNSTVTDGLRIFKYRYRTFACALKWQYYDKKPNLITDKRLSTMQEIDYLQLYINMDQYEYRLETDTTIEKMAEYTGLDKKLFSAPLPNINRTVIKLTNKILQSITSDVTLANDET
jgi:hypothetical protein